MDPRRIEEVSLNSWPALQQILFDGWLLRFARGCTKRANSVNPLYPSTLDVKAKVDACEAHYARQGLPPVFRLTPFSSPADLDRVLESRGYRTIDPTSVLYLHLKDLQLPRAPSGELREETLDDWLAIYASLNGAALAQQTHREILQAIPSGRFPVSLAAAGQPVACGLGVLEGDYVGLFDLVTAEPARKKGYGTRLVSSLLRWAQAQGAAHAYLQVVQGNEPARRLYDKLGFREAYGYWYRVRTAAGQV